MTKFFLVLLLFSFDSYAQSFQKKLNRVRRNYGLPGIAVGMSHTFQAPVYVSGHRDIEKTEKIRKEDKFMIASNSKSMTAALIAMAIDEGRLRWNTTIAELGLWPHAYHVIAGITIEQLLTHMSGLRRAPTMISNHVPGNPPYLAREQTIHNSLIFPLLHPPGTKFSYSNLGYMVLGHILEHVYGKSYESIISKRLFEPLNMYGCGIHNRIQNEGANPDQPLGYEWNSSTQEFMLETERYTTTYYKIPSAGGIHCNMRSWLKYGRFILNGFKGKSSLISPGIFYKMKQVYPGTNYSFAGLSTFIDGETGYRGYKHGGLLTMESKLVMKPWLDKVIVVATNSNRKPGSGNAFYKLMNVLFSY